LASRDTVKTIYETIVKGAKKLDALIAKNKKYAKSSKDADKASKQSSKSLNGLATSAGMVAVAFAGIKAFNLTRELGELGAKSELVRKNFQKFSQNAGQDMEQSLGKMRAATQGMITDMELQQLAMQSMLSGVEFDDMITAMQFVSKQANATGANVSQKMQTVMTGFARGSAQFLDDVGIQVMGAKDVVGAAVEQMEQKMAIFADTSDSAATNIAKSKTEIENVKRRISENLIPASQAWNDLLLKGFKKFEEITAIVTEALTGEDVMAAINAAKAIDRSHAKTLVTRIQKNKEMLAVVKELNEIEGRRQRALKEAAKAIDEEAKKAGGVANIQDKIRARINARFKENQDSLKKTTQLQKELSRFTKGRINSLAQYNIAVMNAAKWEEEQAKNAQTTVDLSTKQNDETERRIELINRLKGVMNEVKEGGGRDVFEDPEPTRDIDKIKQKIDEELELKNEAADIIAQRQIDEIEARYQREQQLIEDLKSNTLSAISSISAARSSKKKKELNEELDRINKLSVSEKKKEKLRLKAEEEYQESQKRSAKIAFTINTVLAQQDTIRAAISTLADTKGGPITKILAAGAITAVAAGYFAGMSAINNKFYNGGEVGSNGRSGDSQLAMVRSGERVLTPAQNREYKVFQRTEGVTNNTNNNGNSYNISVTVQGGGSNQELTAMLTEALPREIERIGQTGAIDWSRAGVMTA
jgi:hypothetical protein